MTAAPNAHGPTSRTRGPAWTRGLVLYTLVLGIVIADWVTPAGIVVGILLGVPILLGSARQERRAVVNIGAVSLIGFIAAALFGEGPISPEAVWLPNRVFALVAIVVSTVVSTLLQRLRLESESTRADAESARDLNRLLHSLMAHDLRAPLALALQAIEAVEAPLRTGAPVDLALLADVDARLRRSLRTIQTVLDAARAELSPDTDAEEPRARIDVGLALREEVASFEEEAAMRGKTLEADLPADGRLTANIDASVLRQAVAILLDNAVRYAFPGPVRVSAALRDGELHIRVRDTGPGLSHGRPRSSGEGEGLGLRLCELLAKRAGGTLEIAGDGPTGTEFVLRLPVPT